MGVLGVKAKSTRSFQIGDRTISLTAREREILAELRSGDTAREIGNRLYLSKRTVDFHTCHILKKLGVRNQAKALKLAIAHGVIEADATPPLSTWHERVEATLKRHYADRDRPLPTGNQLHWSISPATLAEAFALIEAEHGEDYATALLKELGPVLDGRNHETPAGCAILSAVERALTAKRIRAGWVPDCPAVELDRAA